MFVLDMSVGCGIGQIASAALAGVVSAFRVFSFASGMFLLHD